jgi:hypothetical protein
MNSIDKQLQNIWENLAFQSKIFFKSHDLSIYIQFSLLWIPLFLTLISFYCSGIKILDYFSFSLSVLALLYYCYFWKNAQLYMSWWEEYLSLYKQVENYFRWQSEYDDKIINKFILSQNKLWKDSNKPNIHFYAKKWVDKTIEKEMKYWNEKVVWWKK